MAASQGRLLYLTSQLSDLEYRALQTSNAKIQLSSKSEYLTSQYTNQLESKKLVIQSGYDSSGPVYTDLNAKLLLSYNPNSKQKLLKNADGEVLVSQSMFQKYMAANGNLNNFLVSLGDRAWNILHKNIQPNRSRRGFYSYRQ